MNSFIEVFLPKLCVSRFQKTTIVVEGQLSNYTKTGWEGGGRGLRNRRTAAAVEKFVFHGLFFVAYILIDRCAVCKLSLIVV
jgi:hypothetical protein